MIGHAAAFRGRFDFARRRPGRSPLKILWFDLSAALCRLVFQLCYRFRITGAALVPREGPCIFVSNHQSLLDPVIVGCAVIDRQFTAMARESLFRFKPFAWLMRSYGAISLKEEGGDSTAFKAALAELHAGRSILIYPEGSRTENGALLAFQPGVSLLVRRAKVPVVPIGIEGAFEAWRRGQRFPHLQGRIEVEVGRAIAADQLPRESEDLLRLLHARVSELVARRGDAMLRSGWRSPRFRDRWSVTRRPRPSRVPPR